VINNYYIRNIKGMNESISKGLRIDTVRGPSCTRTEEEHVTSECLFCRIIRHEIPATMVAEDEHCVAFRDIGPQAPTHVLVVPRHHVSTLDEVTDPMLIGRVMTMAAKVAREENIVDAGYRTVINTNSGAGQTVFHLHVHVLGGRRLTWPPG
jgi:histidine triad (HIT) family protein